MKVPHISSRYKQDSERDRKWIIQLDLLKLNNVLWPLYIAFICLNFLDIYTTILAMNSNPDFYERNILAARLFGMKFQGFILALTLKFAISLPLFYAVFAEDYRNKYPYQIRLVKVGALAALVAGDVFYTAVVVFNNIPNLLSVVPSALLP